MNDGKNVDRPTVKKLALVMPLIRGLLAESSGHDDDLFRRVILTPILAIPAREAGAPLEFTVGEADVTTDEFYSKLRQVIENYRKKNGSLPVQISLPGLGQLRVEQGVVAVEPILQNKVAVVTGAAGAIGAGICKALLDKGCCVAATDIVQKSLDDLVGELGEEGAAVAEGYGEPRTRRVMGVRMDVTDAASVADGFERVIGAWGGVDIVVVNAGIAMVASLMDLDPEAFRRLEKVNVEGTLLTLAEAGRCMRRQRTGGDLILISTKNVFAPGAQFGAYSATKAASHQLARIASLEFAPFGVRVNMVAPDAVFSDGKRKSGLWAEVGPSRMKARGLDEKGLEDYYRNRNLLKARVTAAHVANAVLFFATRQTPTTGATIPVDGGLPDATPR